ncbi:MAG: XRE family transcriptional regulator [Deltaproteobacteria bacterium]|nr:XRE family transcriptional regulator [Deltaproteobacteria bacterium]
MSYAAKRRVEMQDEPVRVLGRGVRAQRGVHLTLRALREAAGRTQMDVTEASRMDQGDISRLEARSNFDDCQVATLQRYLAAIGGRLELVAAFGDKKIIVSGVNAALSAGTSAKRSLQRTGRSASRR